MNKSYIAIDLKSFYASVECVERGLDPLDANLVVADESRTEKTICLAVTPALKSCGIPGRPRLFEVIQKVREINQERRRRSPGKMLAGKSFSRAELDAKSCLALDIITAMPRMSLYIDYSTRIYQIYLKYFSENDIVVYSIDEVFIDATDYLGLYGKSARELAAEVVGDILRTTGITATVGIGTNLYLAKIAMDIIAKKMPPVYPPGFVPAAGRDGVRIAELDEMSYRRSLWAHTPLTDFWRCGAGISRKLEENGMISMGDVARRSLHDEEIFYRLFGVNAELLIDHAWGYEPCTIADIKAYRPSAHSLSQGQVLSRPYDNSEGELVTLEMAEALALDLVYKKLTTDRITLTVGYDAAPEGYSGAVTTDHYGKIIPAHAHGTEHIPCGTSSARLIRVAAKALFERITDPALSIRRINIVACDVVPEERETEPPAQLDLFSDSAALEKRERETARERNMQRALLKLKLRYGGDVVFRGMDLLDGATARERSRQIGGHRA